MFGVVFATLYAAPRVYTPRTATTAALRTNPVPREAMVPIAIDRVDRPSEPPAAVICGSRVAAAQCPTHDAEAGRDKQDTGADAGDGEGDPAVLRAADDEPDLAAELVAVPVDELCADRELPGRLRGH